MQTFLPYPDFLQSVKALDSKRLGKQRVEGSQILTTLEHADSWSTHPAVGMWHGYEAALRLYVNYAIAEWVRRGNQNNMAYFRVGRVVYPPWFGDPAFHASHRSNLLRKKFIYYYARHRWTEPTDLPYVWPV
jgi:hypothetical protein